MRKVKDLRRIVGPIFWELVPKTKYCLHFINLIELLLISIKISDLVFKRVSYAALPGFTGLLRYLLTRAPSA